MAKNTKLQVYDRRKEVLELLLAGKSHSYIGDFVQTKYGVGVKSAEEDITIAYKTMALDYERDAQPVINKHIAMYYGNVEIARATGNIQGANQALQFIEKLLGLHKPETQINIQQNTLNLDHLSKEELEQLILKLK